MLLKENTATRSNRLKLKRIYRRANKSLAPDQEGNKLMFVSE